MGSNEESTPPDSPGGVILLVSRLGGVVLQLKTEQEQAAKTSPVNLVRFGLFGGGSNSLARYIFNRELWWGDSSVNPFLGTLS